MRCMVIVLDDDRHRYMAMMNCSETIVTYVMGMELIPKRVNVVNVASNARVAFIDIIRIIMIVVRIAKLCWSTSTIRK